LISIKIIRLNYPKLNFDFHKNSTFKLSAVSALEKSDTMGERIGRIERIQTDFLDPNARISSPKIKKKSVRIRPIRPIRSPIVSLFSKAKAAVKLSKIK
jgi:hypothetical protein